MLLIFYRWDNKPKPKSCLLFKGQTDSVDDAAPPAGADADEVTETFLNSKGETFAEFFKRFEFSPKAEGYAEAIQELWIDTINDPTEWELFDDREKELAIQFGEMTLDELEEEVERHHSSNTATSQAFSDPEYAPPADARAKARRQVAHCLQSALAAKAESCRLHDCCFRTKIS